MDDAERGEPGRPRVKQPRGGVEATRPGQPAGQRGGRNGSSLRDALGAFLAGDAHAGTLQAVAERFLALLRDHALVQRRDADAAVSPLREDAS